MICPRLDRVDEVDGEVRMERSLGVYHTYCVVGRMDV
jgi:hypothetical protein